MGSGSVRLGLRLISLVHRQEKPHQFAAVGVDVRTPEEFAAGHLDGAINVPVDELEQRLSELGSQDQALVLYCRGGSRSASATRALRKAGFTKVHDLGAMSNW